MIESRPLYPFGFGLSYASFNYSEPKLSSDVMKQNSELTVTVEVTNTGKVTAKEVVQMYIKDLFGSASRPAMDLEGFEKIELKPGESKTVQFTINPEMLMFTSVEIKPILEAGDYEVMVETSSKELKKVSFSLQ
ncbi:fibronectin type III-like domain-contianing protein [Catenovulum agarivorans]|uniref:fibronectin type III-like domain-contianing protein n=1 Tax=Catenovulum agarivorans TaxID=1172192 RepID=UPI0012FCEB7F|nr:fibronectin type III-like domain-contianing protein [Catenovulum agarivorans]